MKKILGLILGALTLNACSSLPQSASKPGFNFSQIKSVSIQAKDNVAPLVSKELLLSGLSPLSSGSSDKGDAVLKIALIRENPEKRYIVRNRKKTMAQQTSTSQSGNVTSTSVQFEEEPGHRPINIGGSQPYTTQGVLGDSDSKMIATYAQVALSGEMVAPKTGEVIWAGSYSYEGIDLQSAMEGAVRGLIREIPLR